MVYPAAACDTPLQAWSICWQDAENGGPPRTGGGPYTAAPFPPTQQDGLSDCILLAACGANELLPQSPHVPADVFTACLTTPIKASVLKINAAETELCACQVLGKLQLHWLLRQVKLGHHK